jgi:hypothetical protein
MKLLVFLTVVVAMILLAGGDWSLQVTIIIPPPWVSYYEWLVSFPGFQQVPETLNTPNTWIESGSIPDWLIIQFKDEKLTE